MAGLEKKSMQDPEVRRLFELGQLDLVTLQNVTFGRATLQPGWRWSECIKPLVKTARCEVAHLQYHVTGVLHVLMKDGTEEEFGPGDVSYVPAGHDSWVVGLEPVVLIDISGMGNFAKAVEGAQ